MLVERVFTIGAALCLALAVLVGAAFAAVGAVALDPLVLVAPALFGVLAGIFTATARQAKADRQALLGLGDTPRSPPGPGR